MVKKVDMIELQQPHLHKEITNIDYDEMVTAMKVRMMKVKLRMISQEMIQQLLC